MSLRGCVKYWRDPLGVFTDIQSDMTIRFSRMPSGVLKASHMCVGMLVHTPPLDTSSMTREHLGRHV